MKFYVICGMAMALGVAMYVGSYYRTEYTKQLGINSDQKTEIQQLTDRINDQNTHIAMLHKLDAKHTQELAHAKSEIDTLRADVAAGRRKLRIKARCPVSEAVTPSSVVATTTVELSGETGSTVLDIREDIINDRAKLKYLQEYVNTECYKGKQ
ncbi:lysis protein [Xenorhabdus cabanillasii]|uniref:Rac prophage prophage lambda endopeptidase n=1 Tax=Xenorhabdus cabanillasii JM26 TaxID=1427517 RepID=W1IQT4_9GAMM|nr:lysis protein [Xenorhabdus cabanillasii]PHM76048.1 peptidase [Xenorhabdus cabanillasii JM26]CDL80203.1 putative Rac prophage; prophage lambda endopeptidase [Xenorhabdus cabanillasii JM26]